jgi:hypothetical protein
MQDTPGQPCTVQLAVVLLVEKGHLDRLLSRPAACFCSNVTDGASDHSENCGSECMARLNGGRGSRFVVRRAVGQ